MYRLGGKKGYSFVKTKSHLIFNKRHLFQKRRFGILGAKGKGKNDTYNSDFQYRITNLTLFCVDRRRLGN